MSGNQAQDGMRQHERLIDHFKRVYSIVAGLALTEACRRSLPIASWSDPRLWMFLTLFITLVPIFHGGDRSLDQKYHGHPPTTPLKRFALVWDDYMLLLTAVLFVCIAESIPLHREMPGATDFVPSRFYAWMSFAFGFDVIVLVIDYMKNEPRRTLLRPYPDWIIMNGVMFFACLGAKILTLPLSTDQQMVTAPVIGMISLTSLSIGLFVLALGRTIFDYRAGERFLFPDDQLGP